MDIRLHKNARTTPAIRRELQASTLPTKVLAARYNLSPLTVRKWRRGRLAPPTSTLDDALAGAGSPCGGAA
ncbi:hypothetical protein McPS_24600 [Marichromatium sp. PS1]